MSPAALLTVCALASLLATGFYVQLARRRGWGKAVRQQGPRAHRGKEGTATMGGAAFLLVALIVAPFGSAVGSGTVALMALVAASALLGLGDDLTALRRRRLALAGEEVSTGLLARWRLLGQGAIGVAFAFYAVREGAAMVGVPWLDVGALALVVVGSINAFNFSDGLDGLAAGIAAVILLAFWGDPFAAALLGAVLGFLWYNAHPARVFMGGVGAEALGAAVAGLAVLHGDVWRLPLLAIVPVLEVLSVIAQVGWFRYSGGRRLLRMSPLHHHFELSGWPESMVVVRFWWITAVATALAVWTRGAS